MLVCLKTMYASALCLYATVLFVCHSAVCMPQCYIGMPLYKSKK